jgi:hypothetical protein
MRVICLTVLALFAIAVSGWSSAVAACSCPKEAMIKKHGTVSAIEPSPQTPPAETATPAEPASTVEAAAANDSAESLDSAVGTGYSPDPELQ